MISQKQLNEYKASKKQTAILQSVIDERISEIISLIYDYFDNELDHWWYPGEDENGNGSADLDGTDIVFEVSNYYKAMKTYCYNYNSEFPISFLLMTNSQIVDYLTKEVKETECRAENKKNKAKVRKETKKELVQKILSKLTPAEVKALKATKI